MEPDRFFDLLPQSESKSEYVARATKRLIEAERMLMCMTEKERAGVFCHILDLNGPWRDRHPELELGKLVWKEKPEYPGCRMTDLSTRVLVPPSALPGPESPDYLWGVQYVMTPNWRRGMPTIMAVIPAAFAATRPEVAAVAVPL